jgi:Fe2+ or Zn2+ uptake regulation protein
VNPTLEERLRAHGIQPSAQRLAIAEYVLATEAHPSAEQVLEAVQRTLPMLSRATVYNTLNLLVERGLLRQLWLSEGRVVFDANTEPHHHFIDEASGAIHDVPWSAVRVSDLGSLDGYDVREYQVVMRGVARRPKRP